MTYLRWKLYQIMSRTLTAAIFAFILPGRFTDASGALMSTAAAPSSQ